MTFVQEIEAMDQQGVDETVYRILEYFDDLCWAGRFEELGQILDQVDCSKLTSYALVGFLSASRPAKKEIGGPARGSCSGLRRISGKLRENGPSPS